MFKNFWTKIAAGGLAVLALGIGVAATSAQTVAQDPVDAAPLVTESGTLLHTHGRGRGHGPRFVDPAAMQETIADALGITVAELEAAHADGIKLDELAESVGVDIESVELAVEAAQIEAINAAVADGTITQATADAMLEKLELRRLAREILDRDVLEATLAEALGITVAELEAAKADGVRLPELAEQQGVTVDDVQATMEAKRTELIEAAVDAGTITAEQGEALQSLCEGGRGGFGHGGRGGRGGHGGRGGFRGPVDAGQETGFFRNFPTGGNDI